MSRAAVSQIIQSPPCAEQIARPSLQRSVSFTTDYNKDPQNDQLSQKQN